MDDLMQQGAVPTTEEAVHFARDFTERAERAALGNADVMHMWQASADIASSVGGDAPEKAAGQAAVTVGALAQSASIVADAARAISAELVDFVRHSTERSIDYLGAMTRCRTPQDFVTAQTEAMRGNLEMLMDSSCRIAEVAVRMSNETSHVVGRNLKPIDPPTSSGRPG